MRCGTAACRGRAGRNDPLRGSRRASPSPCTPASRRARSRSACRSGSRGSGRGSPRPGACLATTSSKVAFASSCIAHSSPPSVSMPSASNSAGSTCCSTLPSSGRPSESASRFAGSIVSTATFFPRAAIPQAMAAEVVVFPTPPDPAQMQTRLPLRIVSTLAIRRAPPVREISSMPSSGSKTKGSVETWVVSSSRRRASCRRWVSARRCSLRAAWIAPSEALEIPFSAALARTRASSSENRSG